MVIKEGGIVSSFLVGGRRRHQLIAILSAREALEASTQLDSETVLSGYSTPSCEMIQLSTSPSLRHCQQA